MNQERIELSEHGAENSRVRQLRELLARLRNQELAKIREFRRDQAEEKLSQPSDELDVARNLADVELHANLIERSEDRLKAIDAAFSRLEQNIYGECEQCGGEISIERLRALPFAIYCVDCQERRESSRAHGGVDQPFIHRWNVPQEMDESPEQGDALQEPEDELSVRHSAFGAFEEEEELQPSAPRRRGRRRKSDVAS